ncbi:flagellin [Photobacterium angustum]|uniref:flagellin n=1 Tax=Photobacterium angustum TaxID=661 RepID=UPI0005E4F5F5|nr:flagellin [Photobacterium angustum]KJF96515.1 flagellin [Photobacterium angustum]KJG07429.1 flagellin [Photobacterium angustum]PSV96296.1 flagellin [Photobacterium angustum]PSW80593.1 flagellin [Photobacterium angustum]
MAITINTNVTAMTAQRNLNSASSSVADSMQKLSSGLRINSAKDDAAGLQISNRLTNQTNGLNVAMRNANDGVSMAQTAEGAMQESTTIMERMRELALQSANGSNSDKDREAMQKEMGQLQSEMNRIADTTSFGGQNLLDGSFGEKSFQIGANSNETQSLELMDVSSHSLGRSYSGVADVTKALADEFEAGTSTGDKTFSLKLGDTEHKIEVTKDMTAEDFENKLNNIEGISNIKVTNGDVEGKAAIEAKQATQTLSGISTTGNGDMTLAISGIADVTVAQGDTNADIRDAINAEIATKEAATPGSTTGMKAELDKDGNITIAGKDDGTQLTVTAAYATDAAGSTINIGGTDVVGLSGSAVTAAGPGATTNGVTAAAEVAGTFDIDLSKAKFDVGIETYDLNGAGDEAVNTGTVTTESVASLDLSTAEGAQNAIDVLDAAMEQVDDKRAEIGAFQNRMNHTMSNLANINENVNASNSRIKDVDFASETVNMTKGQILQQAGTSILAQAKQIPQAALSLLG